MTDDECAAQLMGAQCFDVEAGMACLYPCGVNQVCPDGLECMQLTQMTAACL